MSIEGGFPSETQQVQWRATLDLIASCQNTLPLARGLRQAAEVFRHTPDPEVSTCPPPQKIYCRWLL